MVMRRIAEMEAKALAGPAENKAATPVKSTKGFPKHKGGGYYELSDGSSVKGKKAAEKAQAKLG